MLSKKLNNLHTWKKMGQKVDFYSLNWLWESSVLIRLTPLIWCRLSKCTFTQRLSWELAGILNTHKSIHFHFTSFLQREINGGAFHGAGRGEGVRKIILVFRSNEGPAQRWFPWTWDLYFTEGRCSLAGPPSVICLDHSPLDSCVCRDN
jgi:hypothetical protein